MRDSKRRPSKSVVGARRRVVVALATRPALGVPGVHSHVRRLHRPCADNGVAPLTSTRRPTPSCTSATAGNLRSRRSATNTGGNLASSTGPPTAPVTAEAEQSCETWSSGSGAIDQQGVALRIAPTADGQGTRAITVNKNIWFSGLGLSRVHVWDSTRSPSRSRRSPASTVVGRRRDLLPWRRTPGTCAPGSPAASSSSSCGSATNPQPDWSDASAVRQVTLPAGWNYPGTRPAGTSVTSRPADRHLHRHEDVVAEGHRSTRPRRAPRAPRAPRATTTRHDDQHTPPRSPDRRPWRRRADTIRRAGPGGAAGLRRAVAAGNGPHGDVLRTGRMGRTS